MGDQRTNRPSPFRACAGLPADGAVGKTPRLSSLWRAGPYTYLCQPHIRLTRE